jgi:hypothetical protein
MRDLSSPVVFRTRGATASALITRFLHLDGRLLELACKRSEKRPKAAKAAPLIRKMPTRELWCAIAAGAGGGSSAR